MRDDTPRYNKFYLNCFLLMLPVLAWNVMLANKLPEAFKPDTFWFNIPSSLSFLENATRICIFVLTLLMPLNVTSGLQKKGLVLYLLGLLLYYGSWVALILYPRSLWSESLPGFMAPAFTPAFWLMGIVMIGDSFYFNLPYSRWLPSILASFFLVFHNTHTLIIYLRLQRGL